MKIWFLSRFSNLSIQGKLLVVILASTLPPLVAGFSYVVLTDLRQFRGDLLERSDLVTRSVSSYLAVGLAFDDPVETEKALEPLQTLEQIVAVYLYDIEGRIFQTYHRTGDGEDLALPSIPTAMSTSIADGLVHSVQPVNFDGRRYGTIYIQSTADALDDRIRAYSVRMTLLGVALIALVVLGAYICQGLISRPIQRLVAATRKVSDAADYSVRVEKEGDDEIGILSDAFNAMVEQIESRQAELERSNRDLDQFAYVASHDLKAPLRAISTLSAWIEEDVDEHLSDESREQMQLLRSRVQRMDRLIEGILQYSRVGRTDSAGEPVDTGALVDELIGYLEPPEGMQVEIADDMPTLIVRRLRLEQVFQNLISNAIKYHHQPASGRLHIGWAPHTLGVEFHVRDDGPGIEPRYHERIFQMFQTLRSRDEVESTGLGLTLVNKLVEEEGGSVRVESDRGAGATFYFSWPTTPPDRDGAPSSAAPRHPIPRSNPGRDMLGGPDPVPGTAKSTPRNRQ